MRVFLWPGSLVGAPDTTRNQQYSSSAGISFCCPSTNPMTAQKILFFKSIPTVTSFQSENQGQRCPLASISPSEKMSLTQCSSSAGARAASWRCPIPWPGCRWAGSVFRAVLRQTRPLFPLKPSAVVFCGCGCAQSWCLHGNVNKTRSGASQLQQCR